MSLQQNFVSLETHLAKLVVGQTALLNRMLVALLCDGHLLVEGAPGLAKTRAIKVLSHSVEGDFHRLQFTPDLLPADLTGTEIYRPQDGSFVFRQGPLFHNLVLADEVNRAPAKVQSALLEAMGERQITVGSVTYPLPELFMVMATQNPIEQEGTYPLPEAQLDRFLMHVFVDYPDADGERAILKTQPRRGEALGTGRGALSAADRAGPGRRAGGPPGCPGAASVGAPAGVHRADRARDAPIRPLRRRSGWACCNTEQAPGRRSRSIGARARMPGWQGETTSRPRTSRPWRTTSCVIGSC